MVEFTIGILGAGHIAGKIAETIEKLDGFKVGAVAARSKERAEEFAGKYGIEKAYGDYDELLKDPDIELVYIATIHPTHANLAIRTIDAGKPVLIEKPISYNAKTAETVLGYAREKNIYCSEAMWTRFMPLTLHLRELIMQKAIGDVRFMTASLGYNLSSKDRLLLPETAGGALLDIGIYPLSLIFMVMGGLPVSVASSMNRVSSNVDAIETIHMNFQNGQMATAFVSMMAELDNRAVIYGTRGRIEVEGTNLPTRVRIYGENNEILEETMPPENQISGYEYEFLAARNAIIMDKIESPEITHVEQRDMLRFMDTLRKTWKITFPLPEEPTGDAQ
ncbi:MAG: Gfo/Idh/MocA family oxidoreductase [Eubacterium sp.]|nr:Gfo/Idh/MocA family oxidoreductase [Eubacterium sp.]